MDIQIKTQGLTKQYKMGTQTVDALKGVDLEIEKGKLVSLFDLSRFRLAAEDALQLPVDLVTTDCSDRDFLNEISQEGVLLYRDA